MEFLQKPKSKKLPAENKWSWGCPRSQNLLSKAQHNNNHFNSDTNQQNKNKIKIHSKTDPPSPPPPPKKKTKKNNGFQLEESKPNSSVLLLKMERGWMGDKYHPDSYSSEIWITFQKGLDYSRSTHSFWTKAERYIANVIRSTNYGGSKKGRHEFMQTEHSPEVKI